MREKKHPRLGFIIIISFLIIVTALVASAAYFALVPKRDYPIKSADSGIGVISLSKGENVWIDGGLKANLLAVAVSRGFSAQESDYPEKLATFNFFSDSKPYEVTLLRNPDSGDLGFLLTDGRVCSHFQKYIRWLLEDSDLDALFCKTSPPAITVMDISLDAYFFDYRGVSLFGEPLHFYGSSESSGESLVSFTLDNRKLTFEGIPAASRLTIKTTDDLSETVFSDRFSERDSFFPESHTLYLYIIETADSDGNAAEYRFLATYMLRPTFSVSHNDLLSGGSFVIEIRGVREGDEINSSTSFGYQPVFSVTGEIAKALVPISHTTKSGEYTVSVSCGKYEETFIMNITEDAYEVQELTITGDGAAANTEEANREYADIMYPLFELSDDDVYWEGLFIQPVDGYITTPYGVYRYTNGSTYATRHAGVDIANAEGTEIVAPNNGRVLFSGFLTLSGNTILIEHGMGLHTLYMHMQDVEVSQGDMVQKGQLIGYIGTTGYSTGPHLHYQMMIRDHSINPWYAQDGRAGFFSAGFSE